jgi:hypothetical protein
MTGSPLGREKGESIDAFALFIEVGLATALQKSSGGYEQVTRLRAARNDRASGKGRFSSGL